MQKSYLQKNSCAIRLPFHNDNIINQNGEYTGLEVVVDDWRADLVEVLEGVDDLHDDRAALLLRHQLILLQVEVQVIAFAVLQHCAEPAEGIQRIIRQTW